MKYNVFGNRLCYKAYGSVLHYKECQSELLKSNKILYKMHTTAESKAN
jgi:hypothetical protein